MSFKIRIDYYYNSLTMSCNCDIYLNSMSEKWFYVLMITIIYIRKLNYYNYLVLTQLIEKEQWIHLSHI